MLTKDQTIRDRNTCVICATINTIDIQSISNERPIRTVQQSKTENTKLKTSIECDLETIEHEFKDLFCVPPTIETPQPLVPGPLQKDTTILAKEAKIEIDTLKEEKWSRKTSKSNTI